VPVLSSLSLTEEWGSNVMDKFSDMHDIIYTVKDGIDGFFINFKGETCNIFSHLKLLKNIHSYFETIDKDYLSKIGKSEKFSVTDYSWLMKNHLLLNIIKEVEDKADFVIAYFGDNFNDIKILHKMRCFSKICLISEDENFIKSCKLFYGLKCIKIPEKLSSIEINKIIRLNYGEDINIILYSNEKGKTRIKYF
jgi:pyruvate kinase